MYIYIYGNVCVGHTRISTMVSAGSLYFRSAVEQALGVLKLLKHRCQNWTVSQAMKCDPKTWNLSSSDSTESQNVCRRCRSNILEFVSKPYLPPPRTVLKESPPLSQGPVKGRMLR